MEDLMLIVAGITAMSGLFIGGYLYGREKTTEKKNKGDYGEPFLDVRLEYDNQTGAVYYTVQNAGHATAHDVRIYLPKCNEIAGKRNGPGANEMAVCILSVMLKRFNHVFAGETVEIPLLQLPPTDEIRRNIYALSFEVEMRWSNKQGDVKTREFILPIFSRAIAKDRFRLVSEAI